MPAKLNDVTPLRWRGLERADLGALSDLIGSIEYLDDPAARHNPDELTEVFNATAADPARNAAVGFHGDSLVAYGWNVVGSTDTDPRRVRLLGGVHPGWRSKGIGRAVVAWQIAQARRWYKETHREGFGPLTMVTYVDERLTAQRDLYERAGFLPRRWFADMHRSFDADPPPPPVLPEGYRLVPFDAACSEEARCAHNEAFAELWGSQPVAAEAWNESLSRSAARPEWSWLCLDADGAVAGYALNSANPQDWEAQGFTEGWTDRLGVRPSHRGRGLAKALLAASMGSFRSAGLQGAGLGVDSENPFGAVGLYRALGYVSADTVLCYLRTEHPRVKSKKKRDT